MRDIVTSLLIMGLAGVYYITADALPRSFLSDEIGAEGYPKLLSIALFGFACILLVQGFLSRHIKTSASQKQKEKHAAQKAAIMLLIGIGYLIAVPILGYAPAVGLLIFTVAVFQGEPVSRKLVLTGVLSACSFWLFFVYVLDIPMPAGIWPNLIR